MKILIAITLILASTLGCNNHAPDLKIPMETPLKADDYSDKLIDAVTSADDLSYVFRGYKKIGNKEYISVQVSGNHINAEMPILVKQWNKLAGLKKTKGVGYIGAELRGLQLATTNDAIAKFEYTSLERIID